MFSNTVRRTLKGKTYLASVIPLLMAAQAQGMEFYAGGVEAILNSKISMGSSWRTEQQDSTLLSDPNVNNGNENYQKGDAFSQIFDGRNDLMVTYKNFGAIASAKYWYDAALENDDDLDDSQYHELAKFSGAKIMDAYVFSEFELLDMPLDVRLGKQVVSWGDSTFIPGGINSINPYDLNTFARPGAKLKDAVIPVNMAFASIGLSDNLSAEMFYQLEYHESVLEGCGTFFSGNDNFGNGCDGAQTLSAEDTGSEAVFVNAHEQLMVKPNSDGQFGVALRYVSEALDTEFGFYAMNIHSRTPIAIANIGVVDEASIYDAAFNEGVAYGGGLGLSGDDLVNFAVEYGVGATVVANSNASSFQMGYTEDVQIVGLSFATEIATMSISGEVSHQRDVAIMFNDDLLIEAAVSSEGIIAATAASFAAQAGVGETSDYLEAAANYLIVNGTPAQQFSVQHFANQDGTDVAAYQLFEVSQLQLTAIKLFDQALGANSVYGIVEAGYTFVHGLDDSVQAVEVFEGYGDETAKGVTQNAWGYRAMLGAEYSDVFAGIDLAPEIFISHDVDGVSPVANSGFNQGNKRLGLTLNMGLTNSIDAAISFNRLTGDDNDRISDRDYASVSVGMQF